VSALLFVRGWIVVTEFGVQLNATASAIEIHDLQEEIVTVGEIRGIFVESGMRTLPE